MWRAPGKAVCRTGSGRKSKLWRIAAATRTHPTDDLSGAEAVLEVLSAIVPEESVCLISAHRADHAKISIRVIRAFDFDALSRF